MYIYRIGEKLEQEKRFKKLLTKLKQYDVISFDIFDTTLVRLCNQSQDIFREIEKRGGISVEQRVSAAQSASKKRGAKTSIEDIYSELALTNNISADKIPELILQEIRTEAEFCCPNATVISLIEELNKCGKEIIFISDMYLPKEKMKLLFDLLHINIKFNAIYVSCDIGKTKTTGTLFSYVAERYPGKKIIHVGDNLISDVLIASKNRSFHAVFMPLEKENLFDRFVRYSFPDSASYIERWAYKELSPALWSFCSWLYSIAKETDTQSLLFLTREGAFLKELYDLFPRGDKCKARVFYASRRSLLCASSDINWKWVKKFFSYSSVAAFFEQFQLDHRLLNSGEEAEKVEDWKRIDEVESQCAAYSQGQRQMLIKMLHDSGGIAENIGLVDVGWRGTSQFFLQTILKEYKEPLRVRGFYWGELHGREYNIEKYGFACSAGDLTYKDEISNAGFLFENILSPKIGTTIRYDVNGDGQIIPIVNNNIFDNTNVDKTQETVKCFFNKFVLYEKFLRLDKKEVLDRLFRRLNNPSHKFACEMGDIQWSDADEMAYVARPQRITKYLLDYKRFLRDIKDCGWKSAFFLRLFKIPLPYFRIYYKIYNGIYKRT